jgi:hypothetical protein
MNSLERLEQLMEQRLGNSPTSDHSDESGVEEEPESEGEVSCNSDNSSADDSVEEEEDPEPIQPKARIPIVVVHHEHDSRKQTRQQPAGIHSFMSSKLKLRTGVDELVKRFKSPKEIEQDKKNKTDDCELETLYVLSCLYNLGSRRQRSWSSLMRNSSREKKDRDIRRSN